MTEPPRHARFVALLDEVDEASRALGHVLGELSVTLETTRQALNAGALLSTVHPNARLGFVRKDVSDALTAVHSALMHARAEGIRVMVESEGLSLRDVSRMTGLSRQFVSRLYHHARDAIEGQSPDGLSETGGVPDPRGA